MKKILIVLLVAISLTTYSQVTLRKGYVSIQNNDTVWLVYNSGIWVLESDVTFNINLDSLFFPDLTFLTTADIGGVDSLYHVGSEAWITDTIPKSDTTSQTMTTDTLYTGVADKDYLSYNNITGFGEYVLRSSDDDAGVLIRGNFINPYVQVYVGEATNPDTYVEPSSQGTNGRVVITEDGFRWFFQDGILYNDADTAAMLSDIRTGTVADVDLSGQVDNGILYNDAGGIGTNSNLTFNDTAISLLFGTNTYLGLNTWYKSRNTTLNFNTHVGYESGAGSGTSNSSGNSFFGHQSGYVIDDGDFNTFLGQNSGESTTNGSSNTFLGVRSGGDNTTGNYNVNVGYEAGQASTTEEYNSNFGYKAGEFATGGYTTGIGAFAGQIGGSDSSVFIGYHAGSGETNNQRLHIGNGPGDTLIYGEFDNELVRINGDLEVRDTTYTKGLSIGGSEPITVVKTSKLIMENTGVGVLQFIDSNIVSPSAGMLWQDSVSLTLNYQNNTSGTTLNIGEEFRHPVYNNTGVTILNNRVVRRTGSHTNGRRLPTIALSGIGSIDSSTVYGVTTHDIPDGTVGYVIKHGDVNFSDTEHLSENESYLGFAGLQIDTMPPPPYQTWKVGEVIYSDADSGIIDIDIQNMEFSATPTFSANFYDSNIVVDILTQNVYQQITNDQNQAYNVIDEVGVFCQGDSVQVLVGGQWNIAFTTSFAGTATGDTWKEGVFINGILEYNSERQTTGTSTGSVAGIVGLTLNVGDWVSWRFVNITSTRDVTFKNSSESLIFLHL